MSNISDVTKAIIKAAQKSTSAKNGAYDTTATVTRTDGTTAWVHIEGGAVETPARMAVYAKTGDVVKVHVSGGSAWITGNVTAPATDDTTADRAQSTANTASENALKAIGSAESAANAAEDAQESADKAAEAAASAQESADKAISDADAAHTAATNAQSSADAAVSSAGEASKSAASAGRSASLAQAALDTMGDWDWETDTEDPSKTKYFYKDSEGAHIVNGSESGYRNDLTDEGMTITEIASGKQVAEFSKDEVTIGKIDDVNIKISSSDITLKNPSVMEHGLIIQSTIGSQRLYMNNIAVEEVPMTITIDCDYTVDTSTIAVGKYLTETTEDAAGTYTLLTSGYSIDGLNIIITDESLIGEKIKVQYVSTNYPISSIELGEGTSAIGAGSFASGNNSIAQGTYSTAMGSYCTSSGYASHSEGIRTTASGEYSHAEGAGTIASYCSHAEGLFTEASHASHAEGRYTKASGSQSHAEGYYSEASGYASHAEGGNTTASGNYSHAEGYNTTASNYEAHAEGHSTTASGNQSHAEGYYSEASNYQAHAEGYRTTASGSRAHAEGNGTIASLDNSHAEGYHTTASGYQTHSEGYYTTASGNQAHAEGYYTTASGSRSHAQNIGTIAASKHQTAIGRYNVEDDDDTYALIIGNGSATQTTDNDGNTVETGNRSNALTVDWNGTTSMGGSLFITGGIASAQYIELTGGTYPYVDFHYNKSTTDYTQRIISNSESKMTIYSGGTLAYTGTLSASSDVRLKENIVYTEVESGLDVINQLQLRSFDWNGLEHQEVKHEKIGFIADEVEEVAPDLVSGGGYYENGDMNVKSIHTFQLQCYEIKAIQELSEKLEAAEKRISELESLVGAS